MRRELWVCYSYVCNTHHDRLFVVRRDYNLVILVNGKVFFFLLVDLMFSVSANCIQALSVPAHFFWENFNSEMEPNFVIHGRKYALSSPLSHAENVENFINCR